VIDCIDACDEVHTMNSLTGFDALLRGKQVVTYGQPFYAGWGLTEDRCEGGQALVRRTRLLTLDELVAGVLLKYPLYWDWQLQGYTTCEAVLRRLVEQRNDLQRSGQLVHLRDGWVRRAGRKARVWLSAWVWG
jgi:capsular polysaccharide export protein